MSAYHFGTGRGHVSRDRAEQINEIAQEHGARFYAVDMPGEGEKYWFSCPNEGHPFDDATAQAVRAALAEADLDIGDLADG